MASLLTLLPDAQRAGVYRTDFAAEEIIAAAKTVDLHVVKLDLGRVRAKLALLDALAKALRFPDHFGKNWDALNDCLTDLSWLDGKGWLLILINCKSFAQDHEGDFNRTVEVMRAAADYWREQKKPFWVLIEGEADWEIDLPKIVSD